jgi:hypothetical protein
MTQLSLLEILPTPQSETEGKKSRRRDPLPAPQYTFQGGAPSASYEKDLQKLKKAYLKQKEIARTANGREAFNSAILANCLKTEIERLEREVSE